jgi:hypothetical protein
VGGDVTVRLFERLNIRGGYSGWNDDYTVDLDEAEVDGSVDLQVIPVLLDWHPAGSGFRISAGIMLGDSEVALSTQDKVLTLDGTDYAVSTLEGSITIGDVNPYLGIGYGNAVGDDGRWHFSCDFGAVYLTEPEVAASAVAENSAVQAALNAALAAEVAELEDELKDVSFYPVLTVGVSFRF